MPYNAPVGWMLQMGNLKHKYSKPLVEVGQGVQNPSLPVPRKAAWLGSQSWILDTSWFRKA